MGLLRFRPMYDLIAPVFLRLNNNELGLMKFYYENTLTECVIHANECGF